MNGSGTQPVIETPDMNAAIQSRGLEFVMGMDVPRQWVTGGQVFVAPNQTMLVLREQNVLTGLNEIVVKNVASLVMPTEVARAIHQILGEQLAVLDAPAAE